MSLSRRNFLKFSAVSATGATLAACASDEVVPNIPPLSFATPVPNPTVPPVTSDAPVTDPAIRLLNRGGYGAHLDERERVINMGLEAYLEEQLHPDAIDDSEVEAVVAGLEYYNMSVQEFAEVEDNERSQVIADLMAATVARAIYSKRQLYEAMVEFWSDHFNIYIAKNQAMSRLKILDDRDGIRPNALGNFRDLLYASAYSPAMLVYLDNVFNRKGAPNENYARELLELHTLGVNGGYTNSDVQEVARILTGLTAGLRDSQRGIIQFDPFRHDDEAKTVMGVSFPAGQGEGDITQLLDMLATHPATAQFIATKLVRRFVADQPPKLLVDRVAAEFMATNGDIKSLLRVIFLSDEFANAPAKLKRPYTYFVSALRVLGVHLSQESQVVRWLRQMGQSPFLWPAPNGYPDVSAAWINNLLPRWNFALALSRGDLQGVTVPFEQLIGNLALEPEPMVARLAQVVLGNPLDAQSAQSLTDHLRTHDDKPAAVTNILGTLLISPAFQEF